MIQFQSVCKTYASGAAALEHIDLTIPGGQIFGVIGRSGAGKSTLLRLVNALERPSSGAVLVKGCDVAALDKQALRAQRRRIGMIFQHFNLLSAKTVAQNIAFPLRLAGAPAAAITQRVKTLLAKVGLDGLADRYPAQLSGGQKQRVGIARALATEPTILLCDEATSALDPQTTDDILQLLSELNKSLGLTIVLITHEMEVIRRICHRVAVLDAGRLVETGAVEDVFLHPRHAATRQMLAEAGLDANELSEIQGDAAPHLRLTFKGAATFEPILGRVARDTGVDYSILSGRIDSIRDQPYGRLIIRLVGGDAQAARQRLTEAGVEVETLS